jgi:hypoxanthine-guanine phosphoribosyltransferase
MVEVYRTASEIAARVQQLGSEIAEETNQAPVVFVGVLKGCTMFLADLAGRCQLEKIGRVPSRNP